MKLLFRVLGAIPCLPAMGGWFKNRTRPNSVVCAPSDVMFNASDTFHPWLNRAPPESEIYRDQAGDYRYSSYRRRRD